MLALASHAVWLQTNKGVIGGLDPQLKHNLIKPPHLNTVFLVSPKSQLMSK